jgi:modulator of FtsH protease HflC
MKPFTQLTLSVSLIIGALVLKSCLFTVQETEIVIITEFGKPVGQPISEPGLSFKVPFIQEIHRFDKRVQEWDGMPNEMPTKDKTYVSVDTFARWRVSDPSLFFVRLRDTTRALSRLEDIVGSETRNAVARHELIEIIRSDKARTPLMDEGVKQASEIGDQSSRVGQLLPIRIGRAAIEREILFGSNGQGGAAAKVKEFGIELLDVRFKRINYNDDVLARVYERMISERKQIAQRYRAEGEGQAARISGNRQRDVNEIESNAYKKVQQLQGEADAKAAEIYARAYSSTPQAIEFYTFTKSLETLQKAIRPDTSLLLSTEGDVLRYLKNATFTPPSPPNQPGQ